MLEDGDPELDGGSKVGDSASKDEIINDLAKRYQAIKTLIEESKK